MKNDYGICLKKKERKDVIGVKGKRSGRLSLRRADIMIIMTSISGGLAKATREMNRSANETRINNNKTDTPFWLQSRIEGEYPHQVLVNTVREALVLQKILQMVGFAVKESAGEIHFFATGKNYVSAIHTLATFSVVAPEVRQWERQRSTPDNSRTQTEPNNQEILSHTHREKTGSDSTAAST